MHKKIKLTWRFKCWLCVCFQSLSFIFLEFIIPLWEYKMHNTRKPHNEQGDVRPGRQSIKHVNFLVDTAVYTTCSAPWHDYDVPIFPALLHGALHGDANELMCRWNNTCSRNKCSDHPIRAVAVTTKSILGHIMSASKMCVTNIGSRKYIHPLQI